MKKIITMIQGNTVYVCVYKSEYRKRKAKSQNNNRLTCPVSIAHSP